MKDKKLQNKYYELTRLLGIKKENAYNNINSCVRQILSEFMKKHDRVGLYCNGVHTQMLMADFVSELRDIVCIIDNGSVARESEYNIIHAEEIDHYKLDGIIISSFKFKEQIKKELSVSHSSVDVLDIYECLKEYDIFLEKEFYSEGPYQIYTRINTLWIELSHNKGGRIDYLKQILEEYVYIKDFRLALQLAELIYKETLSKDYKIVLDIIRELYETEIDILSHAGKDNTLILCLDGVRRKDFLEGHLEKIRNLLKKSSCIFKNAYSYSTMTYESLVPVFTEITNQKEKYYLSDEANSDECRFMKRAIKDKREIFVYGDGNHYIYDKTIKYSGQSQTITEKLWDFVLDIEGIDNGVFYLHELYESHYSFANPYTREKLISNGSAMLFDFLPQISGRLRTDYKKQHEDALNYIDDTLAPFIEILPCNLILFSDHGNLILENDTTLNDINEIQLIASEEWIQIPLVVKTNQCEIIEDDRLISLMEMNNIMLSLFDQKEYKPVPSEYIKIGRSPIYNQQFKELYRLMKCEYKGEAFEGFIFQEGYKLLIFSNGQKKLFRIKDDTLVNDEVITDYYFRKIKEEVSVVDL